MRKNSKHIIICICALLAVSLTGCGSHKKKPDNIVYNSNSTHEGISVGGYGASSKGDRSAVYDIDWISNDLDSIGGSSSYFENSIEGEGAEVVDSVVDGDSSSTDISGDADSSTKDADRDTKDADSSSEDVSSPSDAPSKSDVPSKSDAPSSSEITDDTSESTSETVENTTEETTEPTTEEVTKETTAIDNIRMLTASEWSDLDNWGFFTNIVAKELITFPSYGLDPSRMRAAVTVVNDAGEPIANANVELLNSGETLYRAVTNKQGKAYLFDLSDSDDTNFKIRVDANGESKEQDFKNQQYNDDQTENIMGRSDIKITLGTNTVNKTKTQVMFMVDTTGSMGDEMMYLQSDFASIASEVGTNNVEYSVNFYKDEDDLYLTRTNPFTSDISEIKILLNSEYATGGGDEPEAVAQILDECMNSSEWSDDSVKIAFLVYDAPPHDGQSDIDKIEKAVKMAAEKGIHLVPVVSSNANRGTEVFGRALAIMTNGTYVFLTDDSGIGNSHLEPIIGDHEVEKLHDIIVRIINNYKQN